MTTEAFWKQIKSLIQKKGISQEKAAEMCGININTWRGWSSKGIVPHVSDCKRIAEFLGVTLDYLVTSKKPAGVRQIEEVRSLLDKAREKLETIQMTGAAG